MKMLPLFLVLLAFTGCTPEKPKSATGPDPVTVLTARVADLEERLANIDGRLQKQDALLIKSAQQMSFLVTNVPEQTERTMDNVQLLFLKLKAHVDNTNAHPPPAYYRYLASPGYVPTTLPAKPSMTEGIPTVIFEQIKAKAQADWPLDFQMQGSRIRREVEAFKKVNP